MACNFACHGCSPSRAHKVSRHRPSNLIVLDFVHRSGACASPARFKRANKHSALVHFAGRECGHCARPRSQAATGGFGRTVRRCHCRLCIRFARATRRPSMAAAPHPIWHRAEQALGMPLVGSVSIARNQPWFDLGRPLVCLLAITSGFLVRSDRNRARQLIKIIAWSGATYAAYGIIAHLFDPMPILWYEKQTYLEAVTGTFVNRNTAGAYFGSCAVSGRCCFGRECEAKCRRGRSIGAQYRDAFIQSTQNGF